MIVGVLGGLAGRWERGQLENAGHLLPMLRAHLIYELRSEAGI